MRYFYFQMLSPVLRKTRSHVQKILQRFTENWLGSDAQIGKEKIIQRLAFMYCQVHNVAVRIQLGEKTEDDEGFLVKSSKVFHYKHFSELKWLSFELKRYFDEYRVDSD